MVNKATRLRTWSRFALHFFVRFRWRDNTGPHFGEGTTRDISSKGLFILTETPPPVNSVIRCWFYMPMVEQRLSKHAYKVITVARVLRVDVTVFGMNAGFAASARIVVLRDSDDTGDSSGLVRRKPQ